ncbi:methionine--tRNA ligase [Candidatus Pacearchaeota archaeon]|nr:methionine--tRNA ligase [Candidatus Pacearchaeota archaeon]
MVKKKFYITTAIDYVNAKPHCGHAFEKTLADALARYKRLQGYDVFFLTGVDENAQKNVEAAQKAGVPVKEFIDRNAGFFIELCKKLNISYDDFIRTTAKEHIIVVQRIIKKLIVHGDIYKSVYKGLYCIGCETYYTEKDLVNGKCPEHNTEPELREEEAYFFKLSKYKKELLKIIPKYVIPDSRKNEIISRVKKELNDICISRKGAKWGIDFPTDKDYKIWVWIDALINYISGLKNKEKKFWPADVHVVGKGINWFHAVIWPAILLSAGYKLPKELFVHGYLNIGGKKMSKSLGNALDPLELLEKYPSDSVRYSLLKCSIFDDSDYSEEILINRHNNELANKLGNLISRVSTLAETHGLKKTQNKLIKKLKIKEIESYINDYQFDKALSEIFAFIDQCNLYIQNKKPWEAGTKNKQEILYELSDSIKAIAILLYPFIPETSEKIAKQFNFNINYKEINKPLAIKPIKKSEILFKKIEINNKTEEKDKKENINKPEYNHKGKLMLKETVGVLSEGIATMNTINYNEWEKLDLRVGQIIKVEEIEGAGKLYKLEIDLGKHLGKRVICAGIKQHYKKDQLKNKKIILFTNLAPRIIKGIESKGMILAAVNEDESRIILISPEKDIELGSKIR